LAEEAEKARIAVEEAEKARLAKEEEDARSLGYTSAAVMKARNAHLIPSENEKLTAKYNAISDMGEKAFAILSDLNPETDASEEGDGLSSVEREMLNYIRQMV
jgi:hypothetical protein